MALDKSVVLQKQVKNNSEDLQNEFLDLKNWEKKMKQMDQELRKQSADKNISPPSNCKKKGKKIGDEQNETNKNRKKIRPCDYSASDKFGAEKACNEIDKDGTSKNSDVENMSKEDLQKAHDTATTFKNEGNIFVQQKKWAKAIPKYTEAIKHFPYDATFYANRALCQLKLNNLFSAESDCTAALKLDENYVKAYYRRATVRIAMERYKDAKQDLENVLKLEPSNKESIALFAEVETKIKSANTAAMSENTKVEKTVDEKRIYKNMFPSMKTSAKPKNSNNQETKSEKKNAAVAKKAVSSRDTNEKYLNIPDWLPEKDDITIVEPIQKAPHLRSKKPLRKIPIQEIERNKLPHDISSNEDQQNISTEAVKTNTAEKNNSPESPEQKVIEIPAVPKTATQFLMNWRENTSSVFRYKYLMQLRQLSSYSLFEDLIEPNIISEIIDVLKTEHIERKEDVYIDLHKLTLIKRFRALVMLMTYKDKKNLELLFDYMTHNYEDMYGEKIAGLRKMYEL